MPASNELIKIAIELLVALALVAAGWGAGVGGGGLRRVRRLASFTLLAVLLGVADFLLTPAYMHWRGGPDSAPYTGLVVLAVPVLLALAAALTAILGCVAALTHSRTTRRWGWFCVLLGVSAVPLVVAMSLFALDLARVDPNPTFVLGAIFLVVGSAPGVTAYAFAGAKPNVSYEVTVTIAEEGDTR